MFWFYPNMLTSNQNNNIKFTSNPLYRVNLKRVSNGVEKGLENAVLSELNYSKDAEELEKFKDFLIKKQKDKYENNLGTEFCKDFEAKDLKDEDCNAIEMINGQSLSKKIIALIHSYKDSDGIFHLESLFTNPIFQKKNAQRTLKGAGEIALGHVFKKAKESDCSKLFFCSGTDKFYLTTFEKAGISFEKDLNEFTIKREEFDKYLSYIKKEYDVDFSEKIKHGIVA